MDILISWSKERSKVLATALRAWIPKVLPGAKPWMSAIDIAKGKEWFRDLQQVLGEATACIICVTHENVGSPWIYYETGAIAAKREDVLICPYLLGVDANVVTGGPFGMWQCTVAEKEDTLELVKSLNDALPDGKKHHVGLLEGNFETHWNSLHVEIHKALAFEAIGKADSVKTEVDAISGQDLSAEARQLLIEASKTEEGHLYREEMGGSFTIAAGELKTTTSSRREKVKWKRAIGELLQAKLTQLFSHPDTFELTELGWNLADLLREPVRALDDNDMKALIADWLAGAIGRKLGIPVLVNYEDVDRDLRLPPGSAKRLLEAVAAAERYCVKDRGSSVIRVFRPTSAPAVINPRTERRW